MLSLSTTVNYAPEFYAGSGNATYMSFDLEYLWPMALAYQVIQDTNG